MRNIIRRIQGFLVHGRNDYLMAGLMIWVVLMMIIPLPTIILDIFMTLNLVLSIVILLNVLYIKSALEFSVFPSVLLISTVFSLGLNISSTRLILTQGQEFSGAIIRAFANFVVGSSGPEGLVVGGIIFIIIIAVQYIVITKGASRVAEVSARFTLDSLPGKQMAIEAEFNAGTITEQEHIQKKRDLQQEVDFYGSMDGASKFVSGNIKAGIFITFVNVVGGLIVGTIFKNESIGSAVNSYLQFTIGDGLVSQLPALMISTASGIMVTRAISQGNIGDEVMKQFSNYMKVYYLAGILLCIMAFLPGFPAYILLPLGIMLFVAAYSTSRKRIAQKVIDESEEETDSSSGQVEVPQLEPLDPIVLEVGMGLVSLLESKEGKPELFNRIASIRRDIGVNYGIIIPLIRFLDNYSLPHSTYSVKLNGVEIGRGDVRVDRLLAIKGPNSSDAKIEGEVTKDPAFGLPALWIALNKKAEAQREGYTVAEPTTVISTHITNLIEQYAHEILSRQDVAKMVDQFKKAQPVTIEEVRKHLEIGQIQTVFKRLLAERVSLRNLTAIFETLGDFGALRTDVEFLVEKTRQALSRQISNQYIDEQRTIYGYALHPRIEKIISDEYEGTRIMSPRDRQLILESIANTIKPINVTTTNGLGEKITELKTVVLVTSELARPIMYKLLKNSINKNQYTIPILSTLDISNECLLDIIGTVPPAEAEAKDEVV